MRKRKKNRGQVAIEYLLMLGVVTTIVLTQFPTLISKVYSSSLRYFRHYATAIANQSVVDP